jgi:hypothetical protein
VHFSLYFCSRNFCTLDKSARENAFVAIFRPSEAILPSSIIQTAKASGVR